MNTDNGVNSSQTNTASAELVLDTVTLGRNRDAPPPYTPHANDQLPDNQPVINQTIIVQPQLKGGPVIYNCPMCHEQVLTKVKYVNTRKTHLVAGFVCGLTLWCLMCCLGALPYVLTICKKTEHYCPNCDSILGTYSSI